MSDNATMKNTTIHDMTTGSPARLIMQFMIPMFLGNIFQQFYNIADSIIAGQFLGVRALAAIGSTGSLMFFVTGWLNGLSSGFAILVSFNEEYGDKVMERLKGVKNKETIQFRMNEPEESIEGYQWEMLAYPVMQALGIRGEEL